MPIERVSKQFKDISLSFKVNPLNYDAIALKNETAIARSVRNLVLTLPGERFFEPKLGSEVSRSLFENVDQISAKVLRDQIEDTIKRYEPRVSLISVIVDPVYDELLFNVTITYNIIGIDVLPQKLSFALQPTR